MSTHTLTPSPDTTLTHEGLTVTATQAAHVRNHLHTIDHHDGAGPRYCGEHVSTVDYRVEGGGEVLRVKVRTQVYRGQVQVQTFAWRAATGHMVRAAKWEPYVAAALALHSRLVDEVGLRRLVRETRDLAGCPPVTERPAYTPAAR